jgi:hypothetical protein
MAGLDSIKHFADGGDVEAAPTGKIALDPTQTEAILSNMQKYIDERSGGWNQFMGGINKAYATTYGPSAVTAYEQQKNQEDKQIMDYRTQMAAYRAAQAQAKNEAEAYYGTNAPATGGVAGAAPAGGGVTFPPEIQRQLDQLPKNDIAGRRAIEAKYSNMLLGEKSKPLSNTQTSYWVEALGKNVPMTPNEYIEYKATNKLPGAAAAPASAAAPAVGTNLGNMRPPGKSTGFQEPTTPDKDIARIDANLKSYGDKGINTLSKVISTWSPPVENDTPTLIKNAAKFLGIDPNQPIDLQNPAVRQAISTAIIKQEGNLPKVFATAPAATVTPNAPAAAPSGLTPPSAVQKARGPEEYAARQKADAAMTEERNKAAVAREQTEVTAGKKAEKNVKEYEQFLGLLKETPEAFGITQKSGIVPGIAELSKEGVSVPLLGQFKVPGVEEGIARMTLSEKALENRSKADTIAKRQALDYRKEIYQGTGAVSDSESAAANLATGLDKTNPTAANRLFAVLNMERQKLAADRYNGWIEYKKQEKSAGRTPNFGDYEETDYYTTKSVNDMDKRLAALLPSYVKPKGEEGKKDIGSFHSKKPGQ